MSVRASGEGGAAVPAPAGVVRPARREDLARIWELLHGLAVYERIEHEVTGTAARLCEHLFGAEPSAGCLVAESAGRLVGYALFYPTFSSFSTVPNLWLEDLYVEPETRGQGVGRALMQAVARVALERGCRRMGWSVLDWNQPSIEFYRRSGARLTGAGWLQYGLDPEGLRAVAEGRAGVTPEATEEGTSGTTSSNT